VVRTIDLGREAFARRAWADAYAHLASADLADANDFELMAVASYMSGHDDESTAAFESAHAAAMRSNDLDQATRCAAWLAIGLLLRGEPARAGGWLARAERHLTRGQQDCASRGLLLVPPFLEALGGGDTQRADAIARDIVDIGSRFASADVFAFGMLCLGEVHIASGDVSGGMKHFDEAMISVTAGETGPITSGILYCAVIESCMRISDIRRAAEWTTALSDWCRAQPGLVPYRGQCLVHRSEIMLAHGTWAEALSEATQARARLSDPAHPALGLACYQHGELLRLRGAFDEAEEAYRAAGAHGREPVPGLALLRLASGNIDAARAAMTRMVAEATEPLGQPAVLAAAVEIALAAGDIDDARRAATQLEAVAESFGSPALLATASYAKGAVLLHAGDAPAALPALRAACEGWRELEMPYHAARARVQIALACRALGDHDAAGIELDAARTVFTRLGARPDAARVEALEANTAEKPPSQLTERECEVLRLVATGRTNREIAAHLVISEHTVARHLQNIFVKLGLSSRSAATAYAYEHGLISGAGGQN
jgi:DNA-binding NarL/FixJ family response regulator